MTFQDVLARERKQLETMLTNAKQSGDATRIKFAEEAMEQHKAAAAVFTPVSGLFDQMFASKEKGCA